MDDCRRKLGRDTAVTHSRMLILKEAKFRFGSEYGTASECRGLEGELVLKGMRVRGKETKGICSKNNSVISTDYYTVKEL